MDHDMVVREKMTERYLLNELDPGVRDEFEEHFFVCADCALDVRAGAELVARSKAVLAEMPEEGFIRTVPAPPKPAFGWFAWLRPAFLVPVMATLLLVIGYQNLVTYPKLQSALHQPQVLPLASVSVGTWGESGPSLTVHQGEGFVLFVRNPRDASYASYKANLYDHDEKLEWSLAIPADSQQDHWSIQIPPAQFAAGSYTLDVLGVTAAGNTKEVGKASFELQIQK